MAKKTFREKLDEIVTTAKSKSKDGKLKSTFSRRMFNEVVNAMVNDPDYTFTTVQLKNGKAEEVATTPVKEFREKMLTPILNEVRMDPEDQKKFVENYEFTKGQTDAMYDVTTAAIEEYMGIGKTFRFPSTKDFSAAISIRKMGESTYTNPRTGNKTKRGAHRALVKKSSCPTWLKEKM